MSEAHTPQEPAFEGNTNDDFDASWKQFLDSDFGTDDAGEFTQAGTEVQAGGDSTTAAAAGADTLAGGQGNDTISLTLETPNVSGQTGNVSGETSGAQPEVDPALLAAMSGLATGAPAPSSVAPNEVQPQPVETKVTPALSADEDKFQPFTPEFKLPPAIISGIFESEDTATREQALVGLLSSFGNAICQTIYATAQKEWLPKSFEQHYGAAQQRTQEQAVASAVSEDFYGAFPELKEYKPAVQRAMQVIASQDPKVGYSPELRDKVGALARAALAQAGVVLKPAQKAALTGDSKQAPTPKGSTPFEAGGSRPSMGGDPSSPESILNELTQF